MLKQETCTCIIKNKTLDTDDNRLMQKGTYYAQNIRSRRLHMQSNLIRVNTCIYSLLSSCPIAKDPLKEAGEVSYRHNAPILPLPLDQNNLPYFRFW